MRDAADDVSTENVSVCVFLRRSESSELSAFLSMTEGLQAQEQANHYFSKGPSGGTFPFVKITGPITAIAAALSAYFESRKKKFFLKAEGVTIATENYSTRNVLKLIKESAKLQITYSPDERATFGAPPAVVDKVLEGFAAKRNPPPEKGGEKPN